MDRWTEFLPVLQVFAPLAAAALPLTPNQSPKGIMRSVVTIGWSPEEWGETPSILLFLFILFLICLIPDSKLFHPTSSTFYSSCQHLNITTRSSRITFAYQSPYHNPLVTSAWPLISITLAPKSHHHGRFPKKKQENMSRLFSIELLLTELD